MLPQTAQSSLSGLAFGAALSASRVYIPAVILGQMQLTDFHMLEVFLTASASSALIILILEKLSLAPRAVRSNSPLGWFSIYDGNIIGGAMIGAGMSLTGACPGTVVVQVANRVPGSGVTALGAVLGGVLYAVAGDRLVVKRRKEGEDKGGRAGAEEDLVRHTIASRFGLAPLGTFVAFEAVVMAVVAGSMLALPGREFATVSPVVGGLLIGGAQMVSLLLTSKPVGMSMAYEQVGRYICRLFGISNSFDSADSPMSVVFAAGVFAGSFAFSRWSGGVLSLEGGQIPFGQALIGGCIMTFGARVAGGCTSGHGLSGMASMSYSSVVTVAAMFAAAIGVAMVKG